MSWEDKSEEKGTNQTQPKVEDKPAEQPKEAAQPAETKTESTDQKADSAPKAEEANSAAKVDSLTDKTGKTDEPMVPQSLIGKVAKSIRQKNKAEAAETNEKLRALEEENRLLKETVGKVPSSDTVSQESEPNEEDKRIALKVRKEFLKQQDAVGRKKYGQDYADAVNLVAAQNDPMLTNKIQWADDPVETLMAEAGRIAEEIEYGGNPEDRKRKEREHWKAEGKKEAEAEFAARIAAQNKQPTDVTGVRAAGGGEKPKYQGDSWTTSLKS